jgi:type IV secretion system protein VirD4
VKNTNPGDARPSEPFWERAEAALLTALMLYLWRETDEESQNFPALVFALENCGASDMDEDAQYPMDILFEQLEERDPRSIAVSYWHVFKQAKGRTAQSVLVTAAVRLAKFNMPQLASILRDDDLDLGDLGREQRYLFCVIPDDDTSFNFLVSMLYTQAYQELYRVADVSPGGKLPSPVRIVMDEFANVALPDDFERILSTCRGRDIYIDIIIQAIAQLKGMFRDGKWEIITGDCATLIYLGGNEQSTHEYISKMLGKDTIDTRSYGRQRGSHGGSSVNDQNTGRELLTPDEVRRLDKNSALILVQGEKPVIDRKYNMYTHPHIKFTAYSGHNEPYIHPLRQDHTTILISSDLGRVPGLDDIEIEVYDADNGGGAVPISADDNDNDF